MKCFITALYRVWHRNISDTFIFVSVEESLSLDIPPFQQTQLLEILRDEYDCLTFEEEPCFKSREEVLDGALCMDVEEYPNKLEFERDIKLALGEKRFAITVNGNFLDVYQHLVHKTDVIFKLTMSEAPQPLLYVNEIPIRKFQSLDSYPCRLMKLALDLPNGSIVRAKDFLRVSRGERGCSQDLSEIFKSPVIKAVFAREITNSSFRIYHEITRDSLDDVLYFQKAPIKEKSNTEHFAKMIEECRISP